MFYICIYYMLEVDDEWYLVSYNNDANYQKFKTQQDAMRYQKEKFNEGFSDAKVYYNAEISIRIN